METDARSGTGEDGAAEPLQTGLLQTGLLQTGLLQTELLQVGELAKAAGKTVRAIHHYEEVGLLRPSARSKGRFRLYDASAVTRVRWIGKLHDLGMSLAEIQEVLASWEAAPTAPGAMAAIRAVYAEKLEGTRLQIARLAELERELQASLEYLDTCDRCDPAELIAACSTCQVRDASDLAPELVAGISGCSCAPRSAVPVPSVLVPAPSQSSVACRPGSETPPVRDTPPVRQ